MTLSACRGEPPVDPEDAAKRSEALRDAKQAKSEQAAAKRAIAEHQAIHDQVLAQLQQLEQTEAERVARYQAAEAVHRKYHETIAEAQAVAEECRKSKRGSDKATELHAYLAGYAAEPERDAALTGLEVCRKAIIKDKTAALKKDRRSAAEIQEALRTAGVLEDWSTPPVGELAPPAKPKPPPPPGGPERQQLGEREAAEKVTLETEVAREAKEAERLRSTNQLLERIEARDRQRLTEWRDREVDAGRNVQIAGGVLGAVGVTLTSVGGYMASVRSGTAQAIDDLEALETMGVPVDTSPLDDKLKQQTVGMALGLGLGIPLVITGIVMLISGGQRKANARDLSLAPGGLRLQF
jgi:hypothetical protein